VNIYASNLGVSQSHGALLGTASTAITDIGLAFYDVPISFTFLPGNRYDVAFEPLLPVNDWSFSVNDMEFWGFDFPGSPSYVVGPVTVLDGFCTGSGSCADYGNSVMPHVRLDGQPEPSIPAPASLALLIAGVVSAVAISRRYRRS
jgi:hypothetical protein